jgi:hypothetical protein
MPFHPKAKLQFHKHSSPVKGKGKRVMKNKLFRITEIRTLYFNSLVIPIKARLKHALPVLITYIKVYQCPFINSEFSKSIYRLAPTSYSKYDLLPTLVSFVNFYSPLKKIFQNQKSLRWIPIIYNIFIKTSLFKKMKMYSININ